MRLSKTVIFIVLLVVVLLLIKFVALNKDTPKPAATAGSAAAAVGVSAVIVKPQKLDQIINSSGTVLANEEVDLHPESSGKITELLLKEGTRVNKGDLLVKINDADLQAQLRKTELEIKLAEDKVRRNEKLLEIKGISQEDYDVLLNQLQSYKSDRDVILAQISKTEIHAPFSGIVGLKSVSEGSYVSPSTTIAGMQQIDPVKIDFSVPEKYSSMVAKGDEIMFTLSSSGKIFKGSIYAIEPKVDQNTRTVQIRALSPNANSEILAGAFAKITLVLHQQNDALMVPTESIVPVLKGKQVYVYHSGKAEAMKVETDFRNDTAIQVITGINPNDTVITTGLMQLRPGMAVSVTLK
jgi:membrane fusion protein (multidrug efflux system)